MTDSEALDILHSLKDKNGNQSMRKLYHESLQIHFPELHEWLMNRYSWMPKDIKQTKITEILYCLEHGIEEQPKCNVCQRPLKFIIYKKGYHEYCSDECRCIGTKTKISQTHLKRSREDIETSTEKRKKTNLQRYGHSFTGQVEEFKEKAKKTCLEKYNCEYSFQSENNKTKAKATLLERYGVDCPTKNKEIQEKIAKTCLEKFGKKSPFLKEEVRKALYEASKPKKEARWLQKGYEVHYKNDSSVLEVFNVCEKHSPFEITAVDFCTRVQRKSLRPDFLICPICNSPDYRYVTSNEIILRNFFENLDEDFATNERKAIGGKYEMDIYFPSKKIGIEHNGIFWHSIKRANILEHRAKSLLCESKGIELIYIWEDIFFIKKDLVFNFLKVKLGKIEKFRKISARYCSVSHLNIKEAEEFLNRNNFDGFIKSDLYYGLYYRDKLLAAALFDRSTDNDFILTRFCVEQKNIVYGAFGKILKTFKEENSFNNLYAYHKRDYGRTKMFSKLGFEDLGFSEPNCFYTNRIDFCRGKDRTENLKECEYFCCYDSGNQIYVLRNKG